jgi:hypothetical protein
MTDQAAKVESTREPDDYVAWLRFTKGGSIVTCDSDAPKAFKVYRHSKARDSALIRLGETMALLESAKLVPPCADGYACRSMNEKWSTYCPNCKLKNSIAALISPSGQTLLDQHDAELRRKWEGEK